ncbi:hypothetical protein NITMOv2_0698 [Nitrospira moscoviensis]|uniref:Uncharacterized protein n=1 Tax=Nitrospira moscoviensis TaxID=42253 RepID=A0A0K2G8F4_NITMO|nr:hypothetical protein NITMOv2_0698 [Nitrospira moscoviensis]
MDDLDARLLRIRDRSSYFVQRLLLLESIQYFLAPAFDPEHHRSAMGLGHGWKQMLRDRIDTPFDPPLDRETLLPDPAANGLDTLRLQQEVIVYEIDGPIAKLLEMLQLGHHMGRAAGPPFAFVEDRNVAKHAGPGTAARRLHRREAFHREHRGHVQRHGLHEIQLEIFPVGEGPLIELALHGTTRILHDRPVFHPSQAGNVLRILKPIQQVEQQLFAVPATDEIDLGTLQLDQRGVEARKDPAERKLDRPVLGADLTGQDLGVGIARRAEKAEPDQVRLLAIDTLDNDVVRRLWIRLIEHDTLVSRLFHDGGQGHDADGRKTHDADIAVFGAGLGGKRVELGVTDVDEKNSQSCSLPDLDCH